MPAKRPRSKPDFSHEQSLGGRVAGIDEAGRGPWAGPVVAACVVLTLDRVPSEILENLNDSKKLGRSRRADLHQALLGAAGTDYGIGIVDVAEIDRLNILQATYQAMSQALAALTTPPDHALVDGNRAPPLTCPVTTLVKGDSKSLSIAAASILAKETRDLIMERLALEHPGYGWETNMGYGTAAHAAALEDLGPTPHHRLSFTPVRRAAEERQLI